MPMNIKNTRKPWTERDIQLLGRLAHQNTPTRLIALKLGRTEGAIYSEASKEGISLRPNNRSPYNRRKAPSRNGSRLRS